MPFAGFSDRRMFPHPMRSDRASRLSICMTAGLRGIGSGLILYCFVSADAAMNLAIELAAAISVAACSAVVGQVASQPKYLIAVQAVIWFLVTISVANLALLLFGLPFGPAGLHGLWLST